MSDLIFGIHAVEMALKKGDQVQEIWLQKDAQNQRLLKLLDTVKKKLSALESLQLTRIGPPVF